MRRHVVTQRRGRTPRQGVTEAEVRMAVVPADPMAEAVGRTEEAVADTAAVEEDTTKSGLTVC